MLPEYLMQSAAAIPFSTTGFSTHSGMFTLESAAELSLVALHADNVPAIINVVKIGFNFILVPLSLERFIFNLANLVSINSNKVYERFLTKIIF